MTTLITMRTVQQLSAEANNYTFSGQISYRSWEHVLVTILLQARSLLAHHDLEDAYILYLRWADLTLNKLPGHQQYEANKSRHDSLMQQLSLVLGEAEEVKAKLERREQQVCAQDQQDQIARENKVQCCSKPIELDPKVNQKDSLDLSSIDLTTIRSLKSQPLVSSTSPPVAPLQYSLACSPPSASAQSSSSGAAPLHSSGTQSLKVGQFTENGESLRRIFVPETLKNRFLLYAESNTNKNLETCGILCGRLTRNAYFVTDLVVPKQESTPDSCQTTHEEELFDYVESKNIFILGWIHTHPTQSCFMSSVDLHTHNSYQIMLPEAVAIVCSPKHEPSWGAFRLTSPMGMDIIRKCARTGFHPHEEKNIYKNAMPGHMRLLSYEFTSKDLR